jgi:phosphoserine phosphatase RsbU/P
MKELAECRVLIVDDVKANVDVLVQALRDDHKLGVALDGESALRAIEKNPPDLVLLDIVMPGIDGYEVCRRLRAAPASRDIPVMFLSSLDEVQDKTLGFEVGGNDYLTKPFEMLEVKARVRSLLKAKAYSDAVKEKIATELAIARDIQLGILPANITDCTEGTPWDVSAVLEPPAKWEGICTRSCGSMTDACWSPSAMSPAKAFRRRSSWPSPPRCCGPWRVSISAPKRS